MNLINKIKNYFSFKSLKPLIELCKGVDTKNNSKIVFKTLIIPILSVLLFLGAWSALSNSLYHQEAELKIENIKKNQGEKEVLAYEKCIEREGSECQQNTLPNPTQVVAAAGSLWDDHLKVSENKSKFEDKMESVNAKRAEKGQKEIIYTGRPSFVDQVLTSIKTVFAGFLLSIFIAIPLGIVLGLSKTLKSTFTWIVQIFKPVSPVVWLLLVSMIVKTLASESDMDKAFLISSISVGLCAMWATLVNTSMGVASVDKDFINVSKVLNLSVSQQIFKIILPSAFPLIFTGLRITLSVAWMVLIAIELLAQSPGLGSFVWEEFQNGASDSNAKIIVAMFVIGFIGFLLDRIMLVLQNALTFTEENN